MLEVRPGPASGRPVLTPDRHVRSGQPWLAPVVVGVGSLALRLATAASGPTDWDSAQYAAATRHFDVTHGQPQPPGYWLYVESGRILSHLGLGPVHALVVAAALASAVAAACTVVAGRDLGGPWVGVAAGAVVATSPFAWFSGSIVATYSFDLLACPLLIVLAWRARPGTWHGVAAIAVLAFLAGYRQSLVQSFALLALVPIVVSTRRWSRLAATVGAGTAAGAVWFVPMVLEQPGGFVAWERATRIEATGAARATSVLDHATGGATNLGTFAGTTFVALAPLALLALLGGAALAVRARRGASAGTQHRCDPAGWLRPWYQSRTAVLGLALVPPILLVALVQFAKGGYLLAYLPAAVIALLLPLGALTRTLPGQDGRRDRTGLHRLARRHDPRGGRGGRTRGRAIPRRRRGPPRRVGARQRRDLARPAAVPGALSRRRGPPSAPQTPSTSRSSASGRRSVRPVT